MFDMSSGSGPSQTTSTVNTTASGTGRIVRGANTIAESGSLLNKGKYLEQGSVDLSKAKNNTFGGLNLSGAKVAKGSSLTFNSGVDPSMLNDLVGNLSKASNDQIATLNQANSDQLNTLTKANQKQIEQLSNSFASAGSSYSPPPAAGSVGSLVTTSSSPISDGIVTWLTAQKGWVVAGIVAAIVLFFWKRNK